MVALKNEALVYDQIKKSLERVISVDIPQIGKFRPDIASKFPMLLYAIADSEQLSLNNLSSVMEIGRPTLVHMLNVLEQTETIMRVYPHGSHRSQVRKPSKYLFTSPAFRAMYFKFIGSTQRQEIYEGKLLEDIVGLYLGRLCEQRSISLTYDSAPVEPILSCEMIMRSLQLRWGVVKKDLPKRRARLKKLKPNMDW